MRADPAASLNRGPARPAVIIVAVIGAWAAARKRDTTTFVETYKVGTLVVDIFDASSKRAIWHGFASDALSDSAKSNAQATEEAVDKLFRNFPGAPAAADEQ